MSKQLEEKNNNTLASNASPPNTAAQEMHSINRYKPNGRPLRVCFSTMEFPPDIGGISNSAKRIATFLKKAGFEVHVFAPIAAYPELFSRLKPLETDGVYVYRIPVKDLHSNNPNVTRCHYLEDFSQFIWSIDQQVDFDIFHGFHLQMTYPCLPIANGRPVIASVRGIDAKAAFDPLYINESTEVLKQANWITSVSSESLRKLNQLVDISNYSGFLNNSIAKPKDAATWALTPKNKGCVGTVCTFRPKKNIPLLIESYAQVNKTAAKKLLLVGEFITSKLIDPDARKYSENLIDMLGIKAEVEITGLVEHERLANYYQSMHVFVISSDHEGLPNTLLEAAIHGVPIVATNIDGIKDIVIDGVNGVLVPPGDSGAMSEAITRVLESPVLAEKLSRGAYQLAMKCSPDKEKQQWLDIYGRELSRAAATSAYTSQKKCVVGSTKDKQEKAMNNHNKPGIFELGSNVKDSARQSAATVTNTTTTSVKKPKVCFTTVEFPPDLGGVSKSAGRITRFLQEVGFEVHVFAPCRQQTVQLFSRLEPVNVDGIWLYRVPVRSSYPDRYLEEKKVHYLEDMAQMIWSIDRELKFDIFHGFFLHMAAPCLKVANGRPVIASVRGMDAKVAFEPLYSKEATQVLEHADWITSVSSESLESLSKIVDISDRSGFLFNSIGRPVDNKPWQLSDKNTGCVGTVCTFRPKKNIPLLIESYAKLAPESRRKLLLVGDFITNKLFDEKASNHCQELIQARHITDQVHITGMIKNEELTPYYQSMNVFVISSNSEGLPNTLLEAASHGVPIVATNVDGMKDIIIDGENGLLVPPGDSDAMSSAIQRVLSSPSLAAKLSAGSYRLAADCSLSNEKQQWFDIYHRHLFSTSSDNAIA